MHQTNAGNFTVMEQVVYMRIEKIPIYRDINLHNGGKILFLWMDDNF